MNILLQVILPITSAVGVPAIIAGIILRKFNDAEQERQKQEAETQAIKQGVQAMLRAQMISEYNKAKEKGYAPIYAKENFENIWKNYHALGVNGVMDSIKEEYMAMLTRKEDAKHDKD